MGSLCKKKRVTIEIILPYLSYVVHVGEKRDEVEEKEEEENIRKSEADNEESKDYPTATIT